MGARTDLGRVSTPGDVSDELVHAAWGHAAYNDG